MISTNSNSVVLVGDYGNWSEEWVDLDAFSNSKLTLKEISGYIEKKDSKFSNVDIFSRFIDSSDFVVRCSKFRTQVGSPFRLYNFGRKTDAIVVEGRLIARDNTRNEYDKSWEGLLINLFPDFQIQIS